MIKLVSKKYVLLKRPQEVIIRIIPFLGRKNTNNFFKQKMKILIFFRLVKQIKKKKILAGVCFAVFLLAYLLPEVIYANGVVIPSNTGLPGGSDLKTVIENFMKWILAVFGFLAIIAFVVSGIMYLTSGGEKERAEKAKKAMNYSIIGVIVGLSGYIIIQAIESWMKGGTNF